MAMYNGKKVLSVVSATPVAVDIEANPNEEATAELTKLKVGNVVYAIPQIGNELVASGTFTNGEAILSSILSDGLYMFTYGFVEAFIYITSQMFVYASDGIRVACPVIYGENGETTTGNLIVKSESGHHVVKVASETKQVADNFQINVYKVI